MSALSLHTESTDSMIIIISDGQHQISLLHVQRPGNIDSEVSGTLNTCNFSIIYWKKLTHKVPTRCNSWECVDQLLLLSPAVCSLLSHGPHHKLSQGEWPADDKVWPEPKWNSSIPVWLHQCHQCMTLHHQHYFCANVFLKLLHANKNKKT